MGFKTARTCQDVDGQLLELLSSQDSVHDAHDRRSDQSCPSNHPGYRIAFEGELRHPELCNQPSARFPVKPSTCTSVLLYMQIRSQDALRATMILPEELRCPPKRLKVLWSNLVKIFLTRCVITGHCRYALLSLPLQGLLMVLVKAKYALRGQERQKGRIYTEFCLGHHSARKWLLTLFSHSPSVGLQK